VKRAAWVAEVGQHRREVDRRLAEQQLVDCRAEKPREVVGDSATVEAALRVDVRRQVRSPHEVPGTRTTVAEAAVGHPPLNLDLPTIGVLGERDQDVAGGAARETVPGGVRPQPRVLIELKSHERRALPGFTCKSEVQKHIASRRMIDRPVGVKDVVARRRRSPVARGQPPPARLELLISARENVIVRLRIGRVTKPTAGL
jgi:hypothetical protein